MNNTCKEQKIKRLESFRTLEEGWDGVNAHPPDINIIDLVHKVITELPDEELSRWNIFPSFNGGIALTRRLKENAMVYFDNDGTCIAFVLHNNKKDVKSWEFQMDDNVDKVVDIINEIDKILKKEYGENE